MIKYKSLWKIYFIFILYNKKLKILTNQNGITTTKFLSSLIKIIKHSNQEKMLKQFTFL